ncbi:arginase family protein [Nanoarchaeota archaeon]
MKLIKIPFGGGGLGKGDGAKDAPDKIIDSMKEMYLNENGLKPDFDIDSVSVDNNNIGDSHKSIYEKVKSLNSKAILLGGDHSITGPAFKGFAENNEGPGLIVFDAHPDLMESIGPDSHEDWLRSLITSGIVDKSKVIIIGLRNWDGQEKEFLELNKIRYFNMKQVFSNKHVCDTVMETVRKWQSFYLSIDIDVIDPGFAPGTGYQEPGGLSSREMIYFIQRIKMLKNLGMIDLVEVNPSQDNNDLTVKLAGKLVFELF